MHKAMFENGLYNVVLYYFQLYPFHNILHQKVYEIFLTALEKNNEEQAHLLENTNLVKVIIDISIDGTYLKFGQSTRQMTKGYIAFIRKLANKILDIQKKNEEINIILESIPQWKTFVEGDLDKANVIESRPLA